MGVPVCMPPTLKQVGFAAPVGAPGLEIYKRTVLSGSSSRGRPFLSPRKKPSSRGGVRVRSYVLASRGFGAYKGFKEYDPDIIEHYYARHPLAVARRVVELAKPVLGLCLRIAFTGSFRKGRPIDPAVAAALPGTLAEMGPIFVKIGQGVSSRPDLITDSNVLKELRTLQDAVAPFPDTVAREILEEQLGRPPDEVFSDFPANSIAAASLGQVYRTRLRASGAEVAVKVQRPFVRRQAGVDLYLLRVLAGIARKRAGLRSDLQSIVDEFASGVFDELDYIKEASNCRRFAEMYGDVEGIIVPQVYSDLTSQKVIVLEWLEGEKAGNWGEDAIDLIDVGIQCTLKQLLDGGFFHADPHASNLKRVVTEDGQAKLAFLDFGMMATVAPDKRVALIRSIAHFINKDFLLLAKDYVDLEFMPADTNREELAAVLQGAFGGATAGKGVTGLSFAKLASNMSGVARKTQLRLPSYYTLILRSLTILEGIAIEADPEFKIVDQAYPYVAKRFLYDTRPELREALIEVLVDPKTSRFRWKRLLDLLDRSSSTSLKPSKEGSERSRSIQSPEIMRQAATFVVSSDGNFLREVLINEVIDLLDSSQLEAGYWLSESTRGLVPPPTERGDRRRLEEAKSALTTLLGNSNSSNSDDLDTADLGRPRGMETLGAALADQGSLGRDVTRLVAEEGPGTARRIVGELMDRNLHRTWRRILTKLDSLVLSPSKENGTSS